MYIADRNVENSIAVFNKNIKRLRENHEDERSTILSSGEWEEVGSWGAITEFTNSAYHIALTAIEAIHFGETAISELKTLNNGLKNLCPWLLNKNLSVTERENSLVIDFKQEELFENGTMESSPNSIRYLPIIGALFNHNSHSERVLAKFVEACQIYDPIKIVTNMAFSLKIQRPAENLSEATITAEMIRLESRATEMKFASYALIVMYAECLALSQKPHLRTKEAKPIAPALPHFTAALNLLQMKFKRTAELLRPKHQEL